MSPIVIRGHFAPKVNLLSHTVPTAVWADKDPWGNQEMHDWGRAVELYREGGGYDDTRDMYPSSASDVFEFAGRKCYDAYGRKNAATAANEDYIANIIRQNHWSVLEHASYTFLIENVSRAMTHELVRHRHFSFSQESQRYVKQDPEVADVVISPTIASELDDTERDMIERGMDHALTTPFRVGFQMYQDVYKRLRKSGKTHKEAAGAARQYLPEATATGIVVTGNPRSLAEFITKRSAPSADAEIRAVSDAIADIMAIVLPEVFGPEARALWDINSEQKGTKK